MKFVTGLACIFTSNHFNGGELARKSAPISFAAFAYLAALSASVAIPHAALAQSAILSVEGGSFITTAPKGGRFSASSKTYTVTNAGTAPTGPLSVSVPAWLSARGGTGRTLLPGQSTTVTIGVNANSTSAETYTGDIQFTAAAASSASVTVSVTVIADTASPASP